ncbi:MAG: phospholipid carrier-dependent glycosyltransferase, partial [Candidatus Binatia bacterium]
MTGLSLVVFFFIQGIFFIRFNAPTYDEAMHLAAGYSYLATADFRLEPQNPPLIKEFLALPLFLAYQFPFRTDTDAWHDGAAYQIGQHFVFRSTLSADRIMLFGRLPNLLLGGVIVGLTGWWAFRLWGTGAAVVAIALGCLEPNLIAHSSLVTTDIGASLFMLLTLYLLWEYHHIRSGWFLAGAGISLGVALVCKFSTVLLLPIIALVMALSLVLDGLDRHGSSVREKRRELGQRWFKAAAELLLILLLAALVIPSVYFFHGFEPWLSGLDRFLTLAREGQPAFFLGEYSYQGWWSYYIVAFLI